MMIQLLGILSVVFVSCTVVAKPHASPQFDEFYNVKEGATPTTESEFVNPLDVFTEVRAKVYSLLDFAHHDETFGDAKEPYNRQKHFGTWIHDKRDDDCLNTRGKVLVRDSSVEVTMNEKGCTVREGSWHDPYSDREFSDARDLQIDHFVPLKNAYISGAHKWRSAKRCLYANFLGNDFHLLAVVGSENTAKSDKTPLDWMPSNKAYHCQYLAQWLKVKMIWDLGLTPPEKERIVELVQENHCDLKEMKFSQRDLNAQRRFIADNMDICQ